MGMSPKPGENAMAKRLPPRKKNGQFRRRKR